MCVCRLLCHVSHTLWEHGHCWYFQLTANSCFEVMSTVEANTQAAPLFFWLQPKKGKTSKDHSLLSNARTSSLLWVFGFLQQNMACYPGHPVAVRKTQFMSSTVGLTAADSQVRKVQLKPLLQIMEREMETQSWKCVYHLLNIIALQIQKFLQRPQQ